MGNNHRRLKMFLSLCTEHYTRENNDVLNFYLCLIFITKTVINTSTGKSVTLTMKSTGVEMFYVSLPFYFSIK